MTQAQGYRLSASTGLHKGDREYQQDQVGLFSHPRSLGCVLGIVADGMGGRTGGRKAADQVLLTARQLFERYSPEHDDPSALLRQIANEAHTVIKLTAISAEQEPHCTVAAFVINPGGECHWLHVGDSRLYHFRGRRLVKRTTDHSYVQMLVERGEINAQDALHHPQGNVLMHCLGTEADPLMDAHFIPKLEIGDALLACSDGLWHYFSDEELGSVATTLPPREATELLVNKARERADGTGDNLSIAVVRVDVLERDRPAIGSAFVPLR